MTSPPLKHLSTLLRTAPPPFIYLHAAYPAYTLKLLSPALLLPSESGDEENDSFAVITIDCVECFTTQILYSRIINDLMEALSLETDTGDRLPAVWDAFVDALQKLYSETTNADVSSRMLEDSPKNLVVLFSRAERLRDNFPTIIVPLTRLAELAQIPISVIFLSSTPWTSLRPPSSACLDPFSLSFPIPTKDETVAYLESLFPDTERTQVSPHDIHHYNPTLRPLYGLYVDTLCQACWLTLKDPLELAYIAATRWPDFVAPLLNDWKAFLKEKRRSSSRNTSEGQGEVEALLQVKDEADRDEMQDDDQEAPLPLPTEAERMRLIKMFTKSFIPTLTTLHPRSQHARIFVRQNRTPSTVRLSIPFSATHLKDVRVPSTGNDIRDQLNRTQKMLIVAAYVCGVNPVKSDVRLFVRVNEGIGGKRRRRVGPRRLKQGAIAKVPPKLLGPGPASLDRIMAVFGFMITELDGQDVAERFVWGSQVLNLVSRGSSSSDLVEV